MPEDKNSQKNRVCTKCGGILIALFVVVSAEFYPAYCKNCQGDKDLPLHLPEESTANNGLSRIRVVNIVYGASASSASTAGYFVLRNDWDEPKV